MENESRQQQQLKHLGFVRSASLLFLAWMSKLYEFMKQQQLLGSTLTSLERMFNPACKMLMAISNDLVLFADNKMDEAVQIFDKYAPSFVKKIASFIIWYIKTSMELFEEARKGGLRAVMRYVTLHVTLFIMSQSMKSQGKLGYLPQIPSLADFSHQLSKLFPLPLATYAEDPQDADILTKWGAALILLSQFQTVPEAKKMLNDAMSKFEEALSVNPTKHDALWYLGNANTYLAFMLSDPGEAKGYFDKAAAFFQIAVDEDPTNELYRQSLEVAAQAPELPVVNDEPPISPQPAAGPKWVFEAFQEFCSNLSSYAKHAVSQSKNAMQKAQQETKNLFDSAIQTVQNRGRAMRNLTFVATNVVIILVMKNMFHKLEEITCHPFQRISKIFKHHED